MLSTHYWQRQGRVKMEEDEFDKHLNEMHRYEGIFWDRYFATIKKRVTKRKIYSTMEEAYLLESTSL